MAFKKAQPQQAALKLSMFGPPGAGKTFSALLFAEFLATRERKRVAMVDTERGADFYCQAVPNRQAHPEAFDFDAIYTRSITEVVRDCKALKHAEHACIIIDSISHLWDAAIAAYSGHKTRAGTIPMHAWGKIKAPYKELMHFLINSPFHVFILGRQANEFTEDEETKEVKHTGYKMRAEGETAYEPHICLRVESVKSRKTAEGVPTIFVDKDRSGLLQGKVIAWPTAENVIKPLVGLLGGTQAQIQSEEDAAFVDGEAIVKADREKAAASKVLREQYVSRFIKAPALKDVEAIGKELTAEVKKRLLTPDLEEVRHAYTEARARTSPAQAS